MTPDKRLNQSEPVVADVVQKVDRLIEGNGQIIHEASKIPGIEKNVSTIAIGLVELTINVNQRFDEVSNQFTQVNDRFEQVDDRFDQLIMLIRSGLN